MQFLLFLFALILEVTGEDNGVEDEGQGRIAAGRTLIPSNLDLEEGQF